MTIPNDCCQESDTLAKTIFELLLEIAAETPVPSEEPNE